MEEGLIKYNFFQLLKVSIPINSLITLKDIKFVFKKFIFYFYLKKLKVLVNLDVYLHKMFEAFVYLLIGKKQN